MSDKLYCEHCRVYVRNYTADWNRHLKTIRHKRCTELRLPNLENEEWKLFNENDSYFISNKGRVKCYESLPQIVLDKDGYRTFQCKISGKQCIRRIGRLVAILFIPNPNNYPEVDHIDRNKANDDMTNLRWVTRQINVINRGIQSNNTSGYAGVSFIDDKNLYYAYIKFNGKLYNLGLYTTLDEAITARRNAELDFFYT